MPTKQAPTKRTTRPPTDLREQRAHLSFTADDLRELIAAVPERTVMSHRLHTALIKLEARS